MTHLSAAVPVERQGVLAGRNVARIGAAQPEAFQVAHQGAVTATRLGECAHTAQPRDQRQHRQARRRVKIAFAPLKGRTLAHLRPVSVAGGRPARGFRCDLGPRRRGRGRTGVDAWRRHFNPCRWSRSVDGSAAAFTEASTLRVDTWAPIGGVEVSTPKCRRLDITRSPPPPGRAGSAADR